MAYRDPVFNANVLTDLLGSYLDLKNKEREKYYEAEQKKDRQNNTVIRQGRDGFLYYINPKTKETSRVFENMERETKPTKPSLKDIYNKNDGSSKIVKEQDGVLFDLSTNEKLTPDELKDFTFRAPTKPEKVTVGDIKTGFSKADGSEIKYFKKDKSFYLLSENPDTATADKPMTAKDWSDIRLKKPDDSEKKELKKGMMFYLKGQLKPLYDSYAKNFGASNWQKGTPNYLDMLDKERQIIQFQFPKTKVYTDIETLKKENPNLKKFYKTDEDLREVLNNLFERGIAGEGAPPFILHENVFGRASDMLNLLQSSQNLLQTNIKE
tara:strand:- start:91 stop:1062 length:972 start_codon:yes stop_codon:yes gene_type:complete